MSFDADVDQFRPHCRQPLLNGCVRSLRRARHVVVVGSALKQATCQRSMSRATHACAAAIAEVFRSRRGAPHRPLLPYGAAIRWFAQYRRSLGVWQAGLRQTTHRGTSNDAYRHCCMAHSVRPQGSHVGNLYRKSDMKVSALRLANRANAGATGWSGKQTTER
jgi:hypothetical protein